MEYIIPVSGLIWIGIGFIISRHEIPDSDPAFLLGMVLWPLILWWKWKDTK